MKQKMVYYQDMFNPDITLQAKNKLDKHANILRVVVGKIEGKLLSRKMIFESVEEKVKYLTERAKKTECNCHHPMFVNGVCQFANCYHNEKEHC